eukprot:gene19800-20283_t
MRPGVRPSMTRLLVSVGSPEEAELAHASGADLIDAKDPAAGALGALSSAAVTAIRRTIGFRAAVTAVAGDHLTAADALAAAETIAATGVDMVKVGFFPEIDATALIAALADRLAGPSFRPYASADVIGAEIGGAVKNVLAIACGVVEGAGLGQNARAALIARGFAEMTRFGVARGAQVETLSGLSGLGDLVLTCSSTASRNFSLGMGLGQGKRAADLLSDRLTVAEGAFTAPVLREAAAEAGVDMPVVEAVCALLDGAEVQAVIGALLARPLTRE